MERKYAFDPELCGQWAECDGGGPVEGGPFGLLGSRDFFRGRVTGLYYDEGDPPWRWYEMSDLVIKPEGYLEATVWCEEGFVFLVADKTGGP